MQGLRTNELFFFRGESILLNRRFFAAHNAQPRDYECGRGAGGGAGPRGGCRRSGDGRGGGGRRGWRYGG